MTRRVVLFLVAGVLAASACRFIEGPAATVKRFQTAIDRGDVDAAIECLSTKFVQQLGVEKIRAGLQEAAMKLKRKGGVKSLRVDREDVVGDIAEVVTTVTTGNGETDSDTFKLARENGAWKIQSPK